MEVKEESLRTKNELEKETKERRNELQKYEKRVLSKEETVDKKAEEVEKREAECTARFAELQKREKRVDELELKGVQELERVSGLTSEQAKEELLRSVEDDVKVDVARLYKELENYCLRSIINDKVYTCQGLHSTNITSLTSDNTSLHLIAWKLHYGNG